MRKKLTRALSLLLVLVLVVGLLSVSASAAIDPSVSENRTENSIYFPGNKIWEVYPSGIANWYYIPFDSASDYPLFCVDPGIAASTNPDNFTVYIANGDAAVMALIAKAQSVSLMGDASLDRARSFNIETMDESAVELIAQLISVMYMHKGDPAYNCSASVPFGFAVILAVQNFIWYTCGRNVPSNWYKAGNVDNLDYIQSLFFKLMEERAQLYDNGIGDIVWSTGRTTKQTAEEAEKAALVFKEESPSFSPFEEEHMKNLNNVHYIAINGGNVQKFEAGDSAVLDGFTISRAADGTISVEIEEGDSTMYTVQLLATDKIPSATANTSGGSWAIFAESKYANQSYFGAYIEPKSSNLFMSFKRVTDSSIIPGGGTGPEDILEPPVFPSFAFLQHKLDNAGGYDANTHTPVGGTDLAASFSATYRTDKGASGTAYSQADIYGHGASVTISPWGQTSDADSVVTVTEVTGKYDVPETEEVEEFEFISQYVWDGSATITVRESGAPTGHDGSSQSYTHTITFHAETEVRESPEDPFGETTYSITVDGQDTGLTTTSDVMATWARPYTFSKEDTFVNDHWDGVLQIIKTQDSDDIFSDEHGKGTQAGGSMAGKEYSTESQWTIRIVDPSIVNPSVSAEEAARLFSGYEKCPYIKVIEDKSNPMNSLMHCYKVMTDGTGTPADDDNPLTPSEFGQIYISGLPYGTYLVTEIKADKDRYVKESFVVSVTRDGQVLSVEVNDSAKENVVRVVKVDSETGKTVPSAGTAFRLRYMGSPEYDDPSQTPNYGRYLPNASNLLANVSTPEDYIFYTDAAGEVTIPYMLPYGIYQLEEILVPEGYFIGQYGQDGVAQTAPGQSESYGPDGDNDRVYGDDMNYSDRVAIYDQDGNRVDYTTNESIVYNYYTFEVTEQDDHLDGEGYHIYTLTVEIRNTSAKGKVQISKLGERLVGFRETEDEYGNVVYEPIYESSPLAGAKFGIYASRDVLLQDGEEPPTAWIKSTGEKLIMQIEEMTHGQANEAKLVKIGTHKETGAQVIQTQERDKSETNISTVEYLTPTQKGTVYYAIFSRYDEEQGLTYDYEIEFGLEYTAGGWNYTDIHVKRTITADDYIPEIPDDMPSIFNGDTEIELKDATFSNKNKIELNSKVVNEYDWGANHYISQSYSVSWAMLTPEIEGWDQPESIEGLPEIPDGYHLDQITIRRVTIVKDNDLSDVKVAVVKGDDIVEWVPLAEANSSDYFVAKYKEELVTNLPELQEGWTFLEATRSSIYVTDEEGTVKVIYEDDEGNYEYFLEDGSDLLGNIPEEISEGYTYYPASGLIVARKEDPETGEVLYKHYILDTDTGEYRWIDSDRFGSAFRVRVQEIDVTLTQHNTSPDGWRFEMDGIILSNIAENEDIATAIITLPYDVEPDISNSVGCDVETVPLIPTGTKTTITVRHPEAPVDFEMVDGTRVEMVYLGGYTKTTITIPTGNVLPTITYKGNTLDYFDTFNGGLDPDNTENEIVFDDNNYIRTKRQEASITDSKTYYVIEIISDATSEANAFVIQYHGRYQSISTVVQDTESDAQRGSLLFSAIDKTLRHQQSELIEILATDENGIATSSELPLGDYTVRELEAPEGFVATSTSYPFSLEYKDQFTPLVWSSVEAQNGAVSVQLDITKGFQTELNSNEYEPMAGAVFGVYAYTDITASANPTDPDNVDITMIAAGTLVATVTVGDDGKAVETIKLPKGDYYVKEISTLPGYELNTTRFLFRVDDSVRNGTLPFRYEEDGVYGTIRHTGYETAEIQIITNNRYPMPSLSVNGAQYMLDEELSAETAGNGALVENVVETDRSTFRITVTSDQPTVVKFANGGTLTVIVTESGYTAEFEDGDEAVVVDTGAASSITEVEPGSTYRFDPLTVATGYTAETSTIYTPPQTRLTSENGTTLEYFYDLAAGVKKAIITWSKDYAYYTDDDLPLEDVVYYLGDIDRDGDVDEDDKTLLEGCIHSGVVLTENQLLIADMNQDDKVNEDDLTILSALLENPEAEPEEVTVQEPYLPNDAILFETEGFGNNAYTFAVIDKKNRTVTIDLSQITGGETVKIGDAVVTLTSNDEIRLTGGEVTATNTVTGETVPDGYQPDGLIVQNGNTLVSKNRTLSLSSAGHTAEIAMEINYDHSFINLEQVSGVLAAAWLNDAALAVSDIIANGLQLAPGNTLTLVFSDNSIYRVELSNTGYISMSVEGIVTGTLSDIPILKVNGDADNFVGVDRLVITQTMPMDKESLDLVRQYNTKSETFARADSFVKQIQVKINSVATPENRRETTTDTETIHNDLRPYISKVDVTTGKELADALIEIYDSNGDIVAAGWSDKNGKFYFDKPEPGIYTFKEVSAPAGYQLNTEIFTFTVHPDGTITGDDTIEDKPIKPDTPGSTPSYTSVSVQKMWESDSPEVRPDQVTVQLYQDGVPYREAAVLCEENSWQYTWTRLPMGRSYTVEELDELKDYVATVTGESNRFTITNTYNPPESPEYTSVNVRKIWLKDNPLTRPSQVTVQLYQDGEPYGTPVTLSESNGWNYTWTELMDGHSYTVEELDVPAGYTATVTGVNNVYIITNIFDPPGDIPETGDKSHLALWAILAATSVIGVFWLTVVRPGRRKVEQK